MYCYTHMFFGGGSMKRIKGIWYKHMAPENWCDEYPRCSMFDQLKNNAQKYLDLPAIEFNNKYYTIPQSKAIGRWIRKLCLRYSYSNIISQIFAFVNTFS